MTWSTPFSRTQPRSCRSVELYGEEIDTHTTPEFVPDRPWLESYPPSVPADIVVPDDTIDVTLTKAAERWADTPATYFFGAELTWSELNARANQGAQALVGMGVRPGDRVSIVVPNSPSHLVAFHAVVRAGAIVVEHNPLYTTAELADQMDLVKPAVALVWRKRAEEIADLGRSRVVAVDIAHDLPHLSRLALRLPVRALKDKADALGATARFSGPSWHTMVRSADDTPPVVQRSADDTALLLFTGGTTGTPKAANLTHRSLLTNATQGAAWAGFDRGGETVYGMLPFFHAFGMVFNVILPSLIGASVVIFPNFDPDAVMQAQKKRPATFLPGVAPMFGRLLDAAERADADLSSVRLAFAGAMPMPQRVSDRWEKVTGGLLIEGYGMTESSPIALGNPCSTLRRAGTLGIPFPNTYVRIVDPDNPSVDIAPDDNGVRRGELRVRGPQVFAGYFENPEHTAETIEGGWLLTGDIVEMDASGFCRLVDRVKEMINVSGFKVFPTGIEDHLRAFEEIVDAAVVGLPDADGNESVAAAVIVDPDHRELDLESVRLRLRDELPHYAVPTRIDIVDELPRSMIGKVLRRQVRDALMASRE